VSVPKKHAKEDEAFVEKMSTALGPTVFEERTRMETEDVKAGDVVQLRSGGPLMTVTSKEGDCVHCIWIYDGKLEADDIEIEALEKK
jgi:uncharacterized protein YodC (DUF2158 family)